MLRSRGCATTSTEEGLKPKLTAFQLSSQKARERADARHKTTMAHPWGVLELVSESPVYDLKPFEGRTHPVPQSYALSAPRHAIGRAKDRQGLPTLELPFAVISGKHCLIERDDNGTIRITDHSSNGTSVEKETLGKATPKFSMMASTLQCSSDKKRRPKIKMDLAPSLNVFRRRDDKPETRAVAQALERQNAQLEADLRKAREEVDKLLGQLREASTSKATLTRDAAEAIAVADLLRDARQADQACLKAVACARDLAQRVAADAEGRVASLEKRAADSEAALEEAEAKCARQAERFTELEARSKEIETQQAKSSTSSAEQQEALTASERARAEAERARDASDKRADEAEAQRAQAVQERDAEMRARQGAERERDAAEARAITSDGIAADQTAFRAAADAAKREADQGVEDQDKRFREKERSFDEVRQVPDCVEINHAIAEASRRWRERVDLHTGAGAQGPAGRGARRRAEAARRLPRRPSRGPPRRRRTSCARTGPRRRRSARRIAWPGTRRSRRHAARRVAAPPSRFASSTQWRVEQLERGPGGAPGGGVAVARGRRGGGVAFRGRGR